MRAQHEAAEAERPISGREITIASGAKVALFPEAEQGTSVLRFTNGEHVTRIKVSDDALKALVALALSGRGSHWEVVA